MKIRLDAADQALDILPVLVDYHAHREDRQQQLRRAHAKDQRGDRDRQRAAKRAERDLPAQKRKEDEGAEDRCAHAPVDHQRNDPADSDALPAAKIVHEGEAVPQHDRHAAGHQPPVAQPAGTVQSAAEHKIADQHRQHRLDHVARQRQYAGAPAEGARHVRRAGVAASLAADVHPQHARQPDRKTDRAQNITGQYDKRKLDRRHFIASQAASFCKVLPIIHKRVRLFNRNSRLLKTCPIFSLRFAFFGFSGKKCGLFPAFMVC